MRPAKDLIEGICLLGRYRPEGYPYDADGCWLLHRADEAAVVDLPPYAVGGETPQDRALEVCRDKGLSLRYLLCTHAKDDHFSRETFRGFRSTFPDAETRLHRSFARLVRDDRAVYFGDEEHLTLHLAGEPLHLLHAPKHSPSDTFVIFRGVAITGDWELETLRSMNDFSGDRVPLSLRRKSIDRLLRFGQEYSVHTVLSSRGNDIRRNADFGRLMGESLMDRDFGWGMPVREARD